VLRQSLPTTKGSVRLGYTFDTIGPCKTWFNQRRYATHYEIIEFEPRKQVKIALKDSRPSRKQSGKWSLKLHPEGTQVACHVVFTPWLRYLFLVPLMWVNRRAIFPRLRLFKRRVGKTSVIASSGYYKYISLLQPFFLLKRYIIRPWYGVG